MRILPPIIIATLLVLSVAPSDAMPAIIGSGRLEAMAARQDLHDDVCIAMADGSLSRRERLQLLSRAHDTLTPQEYDRFRASIDRLQKSTDYVSGRRQYDGSVPEALNGFYRGTVSLVAPDAPHPKPRHYVARSPQYDDPIPDGLKNFWKGTRSALALDTLSPPSGQPARRVAIAAQTKMPVRTATVAAKVPAARAVTAKTKTPARASPAARSVTVVQRKPRPKAPPLMIGAHVSRTAVPSSLLRPLYPTGWCRRPSCGRIAAMSRRLADSVLFFREYLRNFHATGAVLPSGRQLAAALARFVGGNSSNPRRILEVGPGTGAVTGRIIKGMGSTDRLDLVELNPSFVELLQRRFRTEPAFQAVADRASIRQGRIEELSADGRYDAIVSGLPLNNFSADEVQRILAALTRLLAPGGTLSFFEYIGVRRARALVSGPGERARLHGVGQAMQAVLGPHEIRRDAVWLNVPPAWVHHLRL